MMKISFRDALRFVLRGLVPALLVAAAGAAVAYMLSRNPTPVYRATAILLATRPNSGYSETPNVMEPSQVDPDIYRSAVVHGGLLESALTIALGGQPSREELEQWRSQVRVRVDEGLISGLVRVEVEHEDPALAASVSNAVADSLLAWDRDRVGMNVQATVASLHRSVLLLGTQLAVAEQAGNEDEAVSLRNARDQLTEQLRAAETFRLSAVAMGLLEPFRRAVVDPDPVNDRTVLATAAAFVLLFLLTYVVLFFRAAAHPRVRGADDLQRETGLEPLAVLPSESAAQRFQAGVDRIAVGVQMLGRRPPTQGSGLVVVVTSPSGPAERSLLALHLARAYVRAGSNVLVVDADLKHRAASTALPQARGGATLSELLVRGPDARVKASPTGVAGLEYIPVGSDSSLTSVGLSRNMPALIQEWRAQFDVVIIDAPATDESPDAFALTDLADAVVLVSKTNLTDLSSLKESAHRLRALGAAPVLPVLTAPGRSRLAEAAVSPKGARGKAEGARPAPEARARVVQRDRRGV